MKALRSSAFIPVASLLQPFIFSCCAPAKADAETTNAKPRQTNTITFFITSPVLIEQQIDFCIQRNAPLFPGRSDYIHTGNILFALNVAVSPGAVCRGRNHRL